MCEHNYIHFVGKTMNDVKKWGNLFFELHCDFGLITLEDITIVAWY